MHNDAIEQLTQRLTAVEDELAIRNVIVRYGLAADCGDIKAASTLFTKDTRYECGAPDTGRQDGDGFAQATLIMEGREAILAMLAGPEHQSFLPNCAHTNGPIAVTVNSDKAIATGYSRLYLREQQTFRLLRLSLNQWQLLKQNGQWLIHYRLSLPIGDHGAQEILKNELHPPQ